MATSYTVHREFNRDGTYYTRQNADKIGGLSRANRDWLIENGYITEHVEHSTPARTVAAETETKAPKGEGK